MEEFPGGDMGPCEAQSIHWDVTQCLPYIVDPRTRIDFHLKLFSTAIHLISLGIGYRVSDQLLFIEAQLVVPEF
jgi:hypothetical protein